MAISVGKPNVSLSDIMNKITELDLANYYFGVYNIPCLIQSPIRKDNHPSFSFYSKDGVRIHWTDFATKESGGIFDLLGKFWGESYSDVLTHIWEDLPKITNTNGSISTNKKRISKSYKNRIELECKIRDWEDYDLEYWKSFGINKKWLKYADIYPISHKIVVKEGVKHVFKADKYAYAYVEFKEGNTTLKIYQPFNTKGYKWSNRHDRSVISLWTKVPEFGEKLCICASMKDALCLWANTGIPSIAIQGEGYSMSNTAINELKRRYKQVYILLDNDEAGIKNGLKLSAETGFTNIVLPNINDAKDISDLYKSLGNKRNFKRILLDLFKTN